MGFGPQEFLQTVKGQMRLVTGFEIVNHTLSMGLITATTGATLWLWTRGELGVGAVAAATAMTRDEFIAHATNEAEKLRQAILNDNTGATPALLTLAAVRGV